MSSPSTGSNVELELAPHRDFPCRIDQVTDGDTLIVTIDAGFRIHVQSKVRLAGIDCPEMNTEEGKLARAFVIAWMWRYQDEHTKWPSTLRCYGYDRRDKYGRWLADVLSIQEHSLVQDLLAAGYVKQLEALWWKQ